MQLDINVHFFSIDPSQRKKSKKKKRKTKDVERSSGDSDNQASDLPEHKLLEVPDNVSLSQSGVDADSESQGSQDSKTEDLSARYLQRDDIDLRSPTEAQVCLIYFVFAFS